MREMSTAEWDARVQLAACYRLMAHFGMTDLSYSHLTSRVPGCPDQFLVKPDGFFFEEITASNLHKFDLDGRPFQDGKCSRTALVIHAGILKARPDLDVVFHTHTVANTAVSSQKRGLLMLSQHAMPFYGRIAYHEFGGYEFNAEQRAPLIHDLGNCRYAMLKNHGVLVCGVTLPQAFVDHHHLEMACRAQVAALSGAEEVTEIDAEVCRFAAQQYETIPTGKDWPACIRLLDRLYPDYAE